MKLQQTLSVTCIISCDRKSNELFFFSRGLLTLHFSHKTGSCGCGSHYNDAAASAGIILLEIRLKLLNIILIHECEESSRVLSFLI